MLQEAMRHSLRAVAMIIAIIPLAACATTGAESFYSNNTYSAKMNDGQITQVAFESFSTEVAFPSGETAAMLFVRQTDPRTGHQLKGGPSDWDVRYAFNGVTLGRVVIQNLTSSIIPSLVSGAASIKIADMSNGKGTGTVIYNTNQAGASSDTNVGVSVSP